MTTASSSTPTPALHHQSMSATTMVGSASAQPVSTASLRPPRPIHHYDILFLDNDSSNYVSWRFHVETTLDLHKIWSVVDGTFPKPDPAVDPDSTKEWKWKNKEAFVQITMTLKDEPLNSIIGSKSAKEAWDKLCWEYEIILMWHMRCMREMLGCKPTWSWVLLLWTISLFICSRPGTVIYPSPPHTYTYEP